MSKIERTMFVNFRDELHIRYATLTDLTQQYVETITQNPNETPDFSFWLHSNGWEQAQYKEHDLEYIKMCEDTNRNFHYFTILSDLHESVGSDELLPVDFAGWVIQNKFGNHINEYDYLISTDAATEWLDEYKQYVDSTKMETRKVCFNVVRPFYKYIDCKPNESKEETLRRAISSGLRTWQHVPVYDYPILLEDIQEGQVEAAWNEETIEDITKDEQFYDWVDGDDLRELMNKED